MRIHFDFALLYSLYFRCDNDLRVVSYAVVLQEIKKTQIIKIFKAVEKSRSDLEFIRRLDELASLTTNVKNKGMIFLNLIMVWF